MSALNKNKTGLRDEERNKKKTVEYNGQERPLMKEHLNRYLNKV